MKLYLLLLVIIPLVACLPPKKSYTEYQANSDYNLKILLSGKFPQNVWELSGQYQGDMILPKSVASNQRNVQSEVRFRWPGGKIPYQILGGFNQTEINMIESVLADINAKTCAKFYHRGSNDKNYIAVQAQQQGCYSIVGFADSGPQTVNLQPGMCLGRGEVTHEFLHSLGLFHMHSDPNRDQFIRVYYQNIQSGAHEYFDKQPSKEVNNLGIGYDLGSIMHYSSFAFSGNDQPTILPIDERYKNSIGKYEYMSPGDIQKVNKMYC